MTRLTEHDKKRNHGLGPDYRPTISRRPLEETKRGFLARLEKIPGIGAIAIGLHRLSISLTGAEGIKEDFARLKQSNSSSLTGSGSYGEPASQINSRLHEKLGDGLPYRIAQRFYK